MIKQLKIQNFQSHKDSTLEFDPGVNIIVGTSDSGKTAIIRALRWLIWNRPSGDTFRSHWGGKTQVDLMLEDDSVIIRSKDGTSKNLYSLNDKNFIAFGTAVPDEIIETLEINTINFQQQLDQPFLLTESPGEVAHHFNRIAHLENIDTSMENIRSWIRESNATIKNEERWKEDLTSALEVYKDLDTQEKAVNRLVKKEKRRLLMIDDINHFKDVFNKILEIGMDLRDNLFLLKYEKTVDTLLKRVTEKKRKKSEIENFKDHLAQIEQTTLKLNELLKITSLQDIVLSILNQYENLRVIQLKYKTLTNIIQQITETNKKLQMSNLHLINLEKYWHEKMPDVCPLCGTDLSKK